MHNNNFQSSCNVCHVTFFIILLLQMNQVENKYSLIKYNSKFYTNTISVLESHLLLNSRVLSKLRNVHDLFTRTDGEHYFGDKNSNYKCFFDSSEGDCHALLRDYLSDNEDNKVNLHDFKIESFSLKSNNNNNNNKDVELQHVKKLLNESFKMDSQVRNSESGDLLVSVYVVNTRDLIEVGNSNGLGSFNNGGGESESSGTPLFDNIGWKFGIRLIERDKQELSYVSFTISMKQMLNYNKDLCLLMQVRKFYGFLLEFGYVNKNNGHIMYLDYEKKVTSMGSSKVLNDFVNENQQNNVDTNENFNDNFLMVALKVKTSGEIDVRLVKNNEIDCDCFRSNNYKVLPNDDVTMEILNFMDEVMISLKFVKSSGESQFVHDMEAKSLECNVIRDELSLKWNVRIIMIIVHVVLLLLLLWTGFYVFVNRKGKILRLYGGGIMWPIAELMMLGAGLHFGSVLARVDVWYYGGTAGLPPPVAMNIDKYEDELCVVEPWLRELGFSLLYGGIVLTIYRGLVEFRTRKAHRWVVREKDLLRYLATMVAVVLFYLTAWTLTVLTRGNPNHHGGIAMQRKGMRSDDDGEIVELLHELFDEMNYSNTTIMDGTTYTRGSTSSCPVTWWHRLTEIGELLFLGVGLNMSWHLRRALLPGRSAGGGSGSGGAGGGPVGPSSLLSNVNHQMNLKMERRVLGISLLIETVMSLLTILLRETFLLNDVINWWWRIPPNDTGAMSNEEQMTLFTQFTDLCMVGMYVVRCHVTTTLVIIIIFGPKVYYNCRGDAVTRKPVASGQGSNKRSTSAGGGGGGGGAVPKPLDLVLNNGGDLDLAEINIADMDPQDIRLELKRVYTQLEVLRNKTMRKDNPHISKRRGGRKPTHRRFSLQKGARNRDKDNLGDSKNKAQTNRRYVTRSFKSSEASRNYYIDELEDSVCSIEGPSVAYSER